jgi:hypothetical protein
MSRPSPFEEPPATAVTPFERHFSEHSARLPPFELEPVPMTLARPKARGALLTLLTCLLTAGAASASASARVPALVFPVLGATSYTDDFGDPRGQGLHEGNDIIAPKRAFALAVEAGTVRFWTTSSRAGCMLYLDGESGTQYLYVHLNNDLTLDNDNQGQCVPGVAYAKGLENGAKVLAGEPIGLVGDSGDANGISAHLHFEVHPNGSAAVSPYPYLRKARQLLFAARLGTTFTLALTGTVLGAAGEDVSLKLEQVRSWPGGRRIKQAGQKIAVSMPETASIEGISGAPEAAGFSALELLTKGLPVTIWTAPAKVTLAAQSGTRGTLSASRVVVKP